MTALPELSFSSAAVCNCLLLSTLHTTGGITVMHSLAGFSWSPEAAIPVLGLRSSSCCLYEERFACFFALMLYIFHVSTNISTAAQSLCAA